MKRVLELTGFILAGAVASYVSLLIMYEFNIPHVSLGRTNLVTITLVCLLILAGIGGRTLYKKIINGKK